MPIEIFFITVTSVYFFLHIFLLFGFKKSLSLNKNTNPALPGVSVIVAGRNEEENISRCIASLIKLDYPKDLLEIILVNDNSTDNTFKLMTEASLAQEHIKVINSAKNPSGNLKGKANAIDTAIRICSGEIIISTDADCDVPVHWIKDTLRYFSGRTAMVCGFTLVNPANSLFAKMQCIDWMYLLTLASSSAGLKMILSCLGNNLCFTKEAYEKAGGYESIGFSVTEDLALMRKINSIKSLEIKFPADNECLVETQPCKTISELMSQKRRWFRGGIGINSLGYVVGFELYSVNILLAAGLFFLSPGIYFSLISVKIVSELILLSWTFSKFKLQHLYKYYPLFMIYFAVYGLVLPVSFLFRTSIQWKSREF